MTLTCLFIAPLGERGSVTRIRTDRVLSEILTPALSPVGFDVFHADHIQMPGRVLRQVLELVVTADLIVADLTGANPNVMYELAVRHCTGRPVIQITHDIDGLPFDVAGERTIPIDLSSSLAIGTAVREVRSYAERVLAAPSLFASPVTEAFVTSFSLRDLTVVGDRFTPYRISDDGTRAGRVVDQVCGDPPWRLEQTDSSEESLLRIAEFQATWRLARLLLQQVQRNPLAGEQLKVHDENAYVVRARVPDGAFLYLVYSVDTRKRVVQPFGFFTAGGNAPDGEAADQTPAAGVIAREAARLLAGFAHHWH